MCGVLVGIVEEVVVVVWLEVMGEGDEMVESCLSKRIFRGSISDILKLYRGYGFFDGVSYLARLSRKHKKRRRCFIWQSQVTWLMERDFILEEWRVEGFGSVAI